MTTTRRRRWLWIAVQKLLLILVMFVAVAGVAEAATQRMLLLPGTHTIAGGGSTDIPARCLDFGSKTPGNGEKFTHLPVNMSSVQVSIAGGSPRSLQQAIDSGDVTVEGTGSHTSMRLRNLSADRDVTIGIAKTSVIAPDKSY